MYFENFRKKKSRGVKSGEGGDQGMCPLFLSRNA
jgi:hypothetical protein